MRELREDTFSENKDEDAHDHIDWVLSIVAAKRWVDRLAPRTINTWDLLKKAFIQSNDGLAALVIKLDTLGRDMKKLKESVYAIQVRCQICEGPHVDKDCPINEEVKQVEEVRYGEFGQTTPFNGSNGGKFRVGPPGYYTKIDNRPPYGEKRQSLEELLAKHQKESARKSTEMEVWIKKLQENTEINTRNQSASLKNLETHIEKLTKEIHSDKTLDSSSEQIKTITADQETSGHNKLRGVSFISDPESDATEVLQHQLPHKELNPGNFILPCTIDKFKFYAMADLGASINVMPRSMFEHLHLTKLRKTNMLCEMADMSKKAPLGIVENVLVKIGKFLFLSDFVIIDNTPSETTILGRPFLATIRAEIDVFAGKISLGINEDRISFDSMRNSHKYTNPSEIIFMVRPQSPAQSNNQIDYEESAHFCSPIKQNIKEQTKMWPSCDPDKKMYGGEVEICERTTKANQRGNGFYECDAQGHFKRECPKLKNNHRGNQVEWEMAPAKVVTNS
ncbi:reverse transcriptase domain-containing protein [Tanacetum coccineum]